MAKGEGAVGNRKIVPAGSRTPLLATLVVIGVVAAVYFAYYRNQVSYYTGRNLRLLSMLTEQVEGRVEMFAGFLRTSAGGGEVRRGVEEAADGWRLRLQAHNVAVGPPATEGCASLDDLLRPIFARRVGAAFDVLLVAGADGTVLYSIRPPGNSSRLLYRDDESEGDRDERSLALRPCHDVAQSTTQPQDALKEQGQAQLRVTEAAPSMATPAPSTTTTASSLLMTKLSAVRKKTGWRGTPEPLNLASLMTATDHTVVTINGDDYVLFSEPYTFARGPAGVNGEAQRWIVCGLVSASRFRYDVTAVSMNMILFAIAVVLLAICCWPFLRIALIARSQALTITDVVLVVICTIVGAAVLTLALLDAFAYRRIAASADEQLMRFSEGVNDDFARNVGRAVDVLTRIETLTAAMPAGTYDMPQALKTDPIVATYPYIETVSWVDPAGMQKIKFSVGTNPLVPVHMRRYFKEAMAGRAWTVEERGWSAEKDAWLIVKRSPYVLEWVRSMATGDVRAVIAKKTARPEFPVIALGTELIDVSHAVAPPGVEMAIIDENGEVVYHTDTQRIGYENFFTEADQNRDLRSAVIARRSGSISASYWGEDQSMYVRPLNGSPWTLVTFRAKRVTRVLNVEAVLLTLMLLMLSAGPYLVLYIAVLMLTPGYRAPRLWPDAARWGDYLRLCILLIALILLFRLNNYALTPWSSFYGGLILPGLAIVTTYLVLHRRGAPRRFAVAAAVWIIANALVILFFLIGDLADRFFPKYEIFGKSVLILAALAVAALTWLLLSDWRGGARTQKVVAQLRARVGYATLYRLCGVLLLIVGVALAVAGFFRISRHVEAELLVKYAQLRAAADLEHRTEHLHAMSISATDSPQMFGDVRYERFANVFGSNWSLRPPLPPDRRGTQVVEESCDPRKGDWTIPPSAANWMPALYEDSIAIRPLFEAQSEDDLWHWCLDEPLIKLVRRIRFSPDVTRRLWGTGEANQSIVISSPLRASELEERLAESTILTRQSLTQSSPLESSFDARAPKKKVLRDKPEYYVIVTLITLMLIAAFWYATDFIATRVLLIDVGEPHWLARLPLSPTLGDHIFLVRRERNLDTLTGPNPMGMGLFFDVSFAELDRNDDWSAMLERLDSSAAGRNVRIVDFEYGINDAAINDRKLQWLERLLALPDRTLIVVSTVSAIYIRTTPPPAQALRAAVLWYYDRWRALLERFVWVTAEELELRNDARQRPSGLTGEPQTWLERETEYNSFLRRLRGELDPHAGRRHLIDEIIERADTYYAGLWGSCHDDEKLLLYHLAHNGLANQRNRRVLRRLIARGFVRRDPNLQLFSETFRLYVLAAAKREDLVSRSRELIGASTWDTLRIPFFVVIIAFLFLLFTTQKDLMTTTAALATALTTGIPMLMKLIGAFTERRLETTERG